VHALTRHALTQLFGQVRFNSPNISFGESRKATAPPNRVLFDQFNFTIFYLLK
jgi:hypothetical protein